MEYKLDIARLRKKLKDYYGTAIYNASPLAVMELSTVEKASDEEILQMALEKGVDLRKYIL